MPRPLSHDVQKRLLKVLQNKKTQEKVKEDLSLVSIPKLKKIKNEMDLLLGNNLPGQCEEAPEDCQCDIMSTQQCCIIYNVMHGHQPYSF